MADRLSNSLNDAITKVIVTEEYTIANNTSAQDFNYPSGFNTTNCIIVGIKLFTRYGTWVDPSYGNGAYFGDLRYIGSDTSQFRLTPTTAGNSVKMVVAFHKI